MIKIMGIVADVITICLFMYSLILGKKVKKLEVRLNQQINSNIVKGNKNQTIQGNNNSKNSFTQSGKN